MNDLLPTTTRLGSIEVAAGPVLDPETLDLLRASVAPSTWRTYERDLGTIEEWCRSRNVRALPAHPSTVANYISGHMKSLAASTIERRVATWSTWHEAQGHQGEDNPTRSALVRKTLRGLRRRSENPVQATPLLVDDLASILLATPPTGLRALRDRALLVVGLGLGRRRSELVALNVEDLQRVDTPRRGYSVTIRRSKTDQEGEGSTIWLGLTGRSTCPVEALDAWLTAASITSGPVFRSVSKHGVVGERLTDRSVSRIVHAAADRAGLPEARWSGHSLRAGFVTEHARRGSSTRSIARQTGHSPTSPVIHRYVRLAAPWEDNAAASDGWL